jgi:hypothetical protein
VFATWVPFLIIIPNGALNREVGITVNTGKEVEGGGGTSGGLWVLFFGGGAD